MGRGVQLLMKIAVGLLRQTPNRAGDLSLASRKLCDSDQPSEGGSGVEQENRVLGN